MTKTSVQSPEHEAPPRPTLKLMRIPHSTPIFVTTALDVRRWELSSHRHWHSVFLAHRGAGGMPVVGPQRYCAADPLARELSSDMIAVQCSCCVGFLECAEKSRNIDAVVCAQDTRTWNFDYWIMHHEWQSI